MTAAGVFACCATVLNSPADARPSAAILSPAAASDSVDFSLHLRLQNVAELDELIENQSTPQSPLYHHFLTPAQFRARYGPDPARVVALVKALNAAGLQAAQTSTQVISVHGPAAAVEQLLSTKLSRVANKATGRTHVAALAAYALPSLLAQSGAVALHLHEGVPLRPMVRRAPAGRFANPANRYDAEGTYWADDLKQAYQFPAYKTSNGAGVSVAIIDGGDYSDADLAQYLQHELVGPLSGDLATTPKPSHFYLPGASGFDPNSGDSFEADLDAQQISLTAPGVSLTGFVLPDDLDGSFFDAFVQIIELNKWDIVSTSYGICELAFLPAYNGGQDFSGILKAQNDLFKQGNAQGITFVTASGDFGAFACPEAGYFSNPPSQKVYKSVLSVSGFASLPNTISVGGGDLTTSHVAGKLRSTYAHEQGIVAPLPIDDPFLTGNLVAQVFAAGGGVSAIFPRPNYQKLVNTGSNMRTVPDVGGHIGALTSTTSSDVEVFAGSAFGGVVGTSASAPDFAALLAIKASVQHSRLGLENPDIYSLSAHNGSLGYFYFHQSNPGDDGFYKYTRAHQGYNYIYGVGSPHGANFAFLPFSPLAGDPQTASNP
jgi:subtilase family serine protease